MPKPNNPPAFPIPNTNYNGLSMRDYFAAMALQGILAMGGTNQHLDGGGENSDWKNYSALAFKYADAMLAEREKVTE